MREQKERKQKRGGGGRAKEVDLNSSRVLYFTKDTWYKKKLIGTASVQPSDSDKPMSECGRLLSMSKLVHMKGSLSLPVFGFWQKGKWSQGGLWASTWWLAVNKENGCPYSVNAWWLVVNRESGCPHWWLAVTLASVSWESGCAHWVNAWWLAVNRESGCPHWHFFNLSMKCMHLGLIWEMVL